eukprot:351852-Chlamydomonas_euryale.AAC.2
MKQRTRLSNGSAELADSALPQLQAQPAVVYGQQGAIKPKTHVWDGRLLDQQVICHCGEGACPGPAVVAVLYVGGR